MWDGLVGISFLFIYILFIDLVGYGYKIGC